MSVKLEYSYSNVALVGCGYYKRSARYKVDFVNRDQQAFVRVQDEGNEKEFSMSSIQSIDLDKLELKVALRKRKDSYVFTLPTKVEFEAFLQVASHLRRKQKITGDLPQDLPSACKTRVTKHFGRTFPHVFKRKYTGVTQTATAMKKPKAVVQKDEDSVFDTIPDYSESSNPEEPNEEKAELNPTGLAINAIPESSSVYVPQSQVSTLSLPGGLENIANFCYLNSILQLLLRRFPLPQTCDKSDRFRRRYSVYQNKENSKQNPNCVNPLASLTQFLTTVSSHFKSEASTRLNAQPILKFFSEFGIGTHFLDNYKQQDAFEFLQFLLEVLEKEFSSMYIYTWFGTSLKTTRNCNECKGSSITTENTTNFSLALEKETSIQTLVHQVTKADECRFFCEECSKEVTAVVDVKLEKVPKILLFHLNRFILSTDQCLKNRCPVRIDKKLSFGESNYVLKGIVEHQGSSLNSGHYICYTEVHCGEWIIANDDLVTKTSFRKISADTSLSKDCYIFLYEII